MMWSPTRPSVGWSNASGTVASTSKPRERQRATARVLLSTTGVELDRPVPVRAGLVEHTLAEGAAGAAAGGGRVDHEARCCHVRRRAAVVRAHDGRAEHTIVVVDGHEGALRQLAHPDRPGVRLGDVAVP